MPVRLAAARLVHEYEHTLPAGKPLALHRHVTTSGSVFSPASTSKNKQEYPKSARLTD
jgi:hypothetical protein